MNFGRHILAMLAASLAAVSVAVLAIVLPAIFSGDFRADDLPGLISFWSIGWLIACLHLVLAVPLYLLLRGLGMANWGTAALSGLVIGVVPIQFAFGFPVEGGLQLAAYTGGAGLVGGLTFRWVLGRSEGAEA